VSPSRFTRDEGQGPPVLFVHGLMASQRVFDAVIAQVKGSRRCLAVDLPCSGKSGPWAPMEPRALASAVARWLDAAGVGECTLVGHSFGGLVALELIRAAPGRFSKALLMSTPGMGLSPALRTVLDAPALSAGAALVERLPVVPRLVQAYLDQFLAGASGTLTAAQLEGYLETLRQPGAWRAMLEATQAVGRYQLEPHALAGARVDVLWGEKDRLVPLVDGERLAVALGSGFEVLPRLGHLLPEEAPEAVVSWLEGRAALRPAGR